MTGEDWNEVMYFGVQSQGGNSSSGMVRMVMIVEVTVMISSIRMVMIVEVTVMMMIMISSIRMVMMMMILKLGPL